MKTIKLTRGIFYVGTVEDSKKFEGHRVELKFINTTLPVKTTLYLNNDTREYFIVKKEDLGREQIVEIIKAVGLLLKDYDEISDCETLIKEELMTQEEFSAIVRLQMEGAEYLKENKTISEKLNLYIQIRTGILVKLIRVGRRSIPTSHKNAIAFLSQ